MFGLEGFEVLAATELTGELKLLIETTAELVGCPACEALAQAKDRRPSWVRDLPLGGRPVVLCWCKRVWCCPHELCEAKTWTEIHPAIALRSSLTERARAWAFAQVGHRDDTVATVARVLGVGWPTIMRLVRQAGTPIVENPTRLEGTSAVGVDETTFLAAAPTHPTEFATGITDLTPGRSARLLEVKRGRSSGVLGTWPAEHEPEWKQQVVTASLDPFRGYATALATHLSGAVRVLDPFHVVRLALDAKSKDLTARRTVEISTLAYCRTVRHARTMT